MSRARRSSFDVIGAAVTAVFTLIGVVGWVVTAWLGPAAMTEIDAQTAQTTATVIEVHATERVVDRRDSKGHTYQVTEKSCIARYTYTVDGQAYQRTSTQCALHQGETVPLHYQPGMPRNAALDLDRTTTADGVTLSYSGSALFIAVGLGIGVFTFRSSLAAGWHAVARLWHRLFPAQPAALEPDGDISQIPDPGRWEQPPVVEAPKPVDSGQ